jgi:hypothetical protein
VKPTKHLEEDEKDEEEENGGISLWSTSAIAMTQQLC